MELNELNKRIEQNNLYQFTLRHKKAINILQGLFIIGLLIAINIYVVKDYFIKKQIAENCGYTTQKYECICEENFVNTWKEMKKGDLKINISNLSQG